MQTETAKSSHFDRTRGLKNQIFPTYVVLHSKSQWTQDWTTQFLHKRLRKDFNSEEKKSLFLRLLGT